MRYNINYIILGISIMAMAGLATDFGSQFNAAANIGYNKTGLTSVDTNLDECIKALDSGNTTLASEHCKMADQALESYLGKQNSNSTQK